MEKVDLFIRTFEPGVPDLGWGSLGIRRGMAMSVTARWALQPDVHPTILCNEFYSTALDIRIVDHIGFHMKSKRAAERLSKSPVYVVCDDDCLILQKNFISMGLMAMRSFPEFGMIGGWNITDDPDCSGHAGLVEKDPGGIVFVRKGILTDFEDHGADKVDGSLADEMRRKGHKVGVTQVSKFNHIGSGYSLTSKGNWNA
jgi:hypothetical protein